MAEKKQASNKIKTKEDLKQLFLSCKKKLFKLNLNTWHFNVSFFVAIFVVSIWVWWVGFYAPKPSQEVIEKFESSRENFEAMKSSTETAIELLKERQEKINNAPDFYQQRDLFVDERKIEASEIEDKNAEIQAEPEPEFEPEPEAQAEPTIIELRREFEDSNP